MLNEGYAEFYISQFNELMALHNKLVEFIEKSPLDSSLGSITATATEISAHILGRTVKAVPRPLLEKRQISQLEYQFTTKVADEELVVLQLYLNDSERLYCSATGADPIGRITNPSISKYLWTALVDGLLASGLFSTSAPTKRAVDIG